MIEELALMVRNQSYGQLAFILVYGLLIVGGLVGFTFFLTRNRKTNLER